MDEERSRNIEQTKMDMAHWAGIAARNSIPMIPNEKIAIPENVYKVLQTAIDQVVLMKETIEGGILGPDGDLVIAREAGEARTYVMDADTLNRGEYDSDSVYHKSKRDSEEEESDRLPSGDEFVSEPGKNARFTKEFLKYHATYVYQLLNQLNAIPMSEESEKSLHDLEKMFRNCLKDEKYFSLHEEEMRATAILAGVGAQDLFSAAESKNLSERAIDERFARYDAIRNSLYDIPAEKDPDGGYLIDKPVAFNIARCLEGLAIHGGIGARDVFGFPAKVEQSQRALFEKLAISMFELDPAMNFYGNALSFTEYIFPGALNPDGKELNGDGKSTGGRLKPPITGRRAAVVAFHDPSAEPRQIDAEKKMEEIFDQISARQDKTSEDIYNRLVNRMKQATFELALSPSRAAEARLYLGKYENELGKTEFQDPKYTEAVRATADAFAVHLDNRRLETDSVLSKVQDLEASVMDMFKEITPDPSVSFKDSKGNIRQTSDKKRKNFDNKKLWTDMILKDIGAFDRVSLVTSRFYAQKEYLERIDAAIDIGRDLPEQVLSRLKEIRNTQSARLADIRDQVKEIMGMSTRKIAETVIDTYLAYYNKEIYRENTAIEALGSGKNKISPAQFLYRNLDAAISLAEMNISADPDYYSKNKAASTEESIAANIIQMKANLQKSIGYDKNTEPSYNAHFAMAEETARRLGNPDVLRDIMNATSLKMLHDAGSQYASRIATLDRGDERRENNKLLNADSGAFKKTKQAILARFTTGDITLPEHLNITDIVLEHYGFSRSAFPKWLEECRKRGASDKEAVESFAQFNAKSMEKRIDGIYVELPAWERLAETAKEVPTFDKFLRSSIETREEREFYEQWKELHANLGNALNPEYLPAGEDARFEHTVIWDKGRKEYRSLKPSEFANRLESYTELDIEETRLLNLEESFTASNGEAWKAEKKAEYLQSGDRMPFETWLAKNNDGSPMAILYGELYEARTRYHNHVEISRHEGINSAEYLAWEEEMRNKYSALKAERNYYSLLNDRAAEARTIQQACTNRATLVAITGLKDPDYDQALNMIKRTILDPFSQKFVTDPENMDKIARYAADILANGYGKASAGNHRDAVMALEGLPFMFQGYYKGDPAEEMKKMRYHTTFFAEAGNKLDARIRQAEKLISRIHAGMDPAKAKKEMLAFGVEENRAGAIAKDPYQADVIKSYIFRNPDAKNMFGNMDYPEEYRLQAAKRMELSSQVDRSGATGEALRRYAKEKSATLYSEKERLVGYVNACRHIPENVKGFTDMGENRAEEYLEKSNNASLDAAAQHQANKALGYTMNMDPAELENLKKKAGIDKTKVEKEIINDLKYGYKGAPNETSGPGITEKDGFEQSSRIVRTPSGTQDWSERQQQERYRAVTDHTEPVPSRLSSITINGAVDLKKEELVSLLSKKVQGLTPFEPSAAKYLVLTPQGNDLKVEFDTIQLLKDSRSLNEAAMKAKNSGDPDQMKRISIMIGAFDKRVEALLVASGDTMDKDQVRSSLFGPSGKTYTIPRSVLSFAEIHAEAATRAKDARGSR